MHRSTLIVGPVFVSSTTAAGWLLAGALDGIVTFIAAVLAMLYAMWIVRSYDPRPYGSSQRNDPREK
jgi:chromate transport protein ChrA